MPKKKLYNSDEFKRVEYLSPEAELAILQRTAEFLRTHPEALHDVMQRAGIITASGKLAKAFGGD